MAGSVNKVILLGNLGANPELKHLPSGNCVAELRVATSEKWKDKNDQLQERTEWHRVVVWGKTAENCAKFLQKGQQVYLEGKLQTRSWDDKDGVKRYTTETVADQVVFLRGGQGQGDQQEGGGYGGGGGGQSQRQERGGGQSQGQQQRGGGQQQRQAPPSQGDGEDFGAAGDDDIPF